MAENILTKTTVAIDKDVAKDEICELLIAPVVNFENVYSYMIYAKYKDDVLTGWQVEYLISQEDKYNTLDIEECIVTIAKTILQNKNCEQKKYVIGYKQPSIDILVEVYDPLIKRLAETQHRHWKDFEFDDLYQMCRLLLVVLYKKGYYIHRRLLEQSYFYDVLIKVRKDYDKPILVGINDVYSRSEGQEDILYGDIIPDMNEVYEQQDKEDEEEYQQVLKQEREDVLQFISQRQYDALVRAYGNKCTNSADQRQVYKLKEKLRKQGKIKEK